MIEVARVYRFDGRHHVPSLPYPWCEPHDHRYTVEVVARGAGPVVVDTDLIDRAWKTIGLPYSLELIDLDAIYKPEDTTVEALATTWLEVLRGMVPEVCRVRVWEDETRWGLAEID